MEPETDISLSGVIKILHKLLNSSSKSINRGHHFIKIKNQKFLQILFVGNVKKSCFIDVLKQHNCEIVQLKRNLVIVTTGESIYRIIEDILTRMENRQTNLMRKLEKINKVVQDALMLNSALKMMLKIK